MQINALRCEYERNPLGIDETSPRLSWQVQSDQRGARQTAYQMLVADSPEQLQSAEKLLWDSGKVISDRSVHVEYDGEPLHSRQRVYWKVRVWDENDQVSAYSKTACWEMALLSRDEWQASWIGSAPSAPPAKQPFIFSQRSLDESIQHWQELQQQAIATAKPCSFLRKPFQVTKQIQRARIYASARGLYYLVVNGQRVGQDYFRPGWTDYRKRIQYQTYDITGLLTTGENVVGSVLGDGWYCGVLGFDGQRNTYGTVTQALVQLEIEYTDGTTDKILSDGTWKTTLGKTALLYSDLFMGEHYDARRELTGWTSAGYDDTQWAPVVAEPLDGPALVAQCGPTVQKVAQLASRSISEPTPGTYVFDLGQNMVGWARLRVRGEAGTTVQIRYAEMLNPDGTIYTTNLRVARATDTYTLKGSAEEEIYEPSFTFHGFRYVEVTGYPGKPDLMDITGIVVQSLTPETGSFVCSEPLVNQLVSNIEWGQRSNFLEVPTDCPQRDERLGWMGDAEIFVRTATYNADVAHFFTKWLRDIEDAQLPEGGFTNVVPNILDDWRDGAPAWADAGIIVPWTIFQVYADTRMLDNHYAMMSRWVDYIAKDNPTYLWRTHRNFGGDGRIDFGDWLSIDADTPKDVLADAFFANSVALLSEIATILGKEEDARKYSTLFQNIKAAFNEAYVSADGRISGDTQTAYVLALRFNLLPEKLQTLAAQYLVDDIQRHNDHLTTGFLGVGHLMPVLTETGHLDVAYRLLLQDSFPSWIYSIRHGATTIWERWDGWTEDKGFQDPRMNSFNHYSLGSVGEWLYRYVAGIDTAIGPHGLFAGYKHILLRPHPGNVLTSASAAYDSLHGRIVSDWHKETDGSFEWHITIPANTTATVYMPASTTSTITESRKPAHEASGVTFQRHEDNAAIYTVGAGDYHFTVQ